MHFLQVQCHINVNVHVYSTTEVSGQYNYAPIVCYGQISSWENSVHFLELMTNTTIFSIVGSNKYPLQMGGQRQHGMRSSPNTTRQCESNLMPFDPESNTPSTLPNASIINPRLPSTVTVLLNQNITNRKQYFSHSPTLYSQITGKYASVESKIFPHILLLCSISYSCFNGLTINQHFIKPLQGEKCTSYLSVVDLSIVLPRVFFFAALCGRTNLRLRSRARTPTKLLRSTF